MINFKEHKEFGDALKKMRLKLTEEKFIAHQKKEKNLTKCIQSIDNLRCWLDDILMADFPSASFNKLSEAYYGKDDESRRK
jgi:hypothetical protein